MKTFLSIFTNNDTSTLFTGAQVILIYQLSWFGLAWRHPWTLLPLHDTIHSVAVLSSEACSSQLAYQSKALTPPRLTSPASLPRHKTTDHKPQRPPQKIMVSNNLHPPTCLPSPHTPASPNEHHPHPTVARTRSRLLLPERLEPAANRFLKNRK